MDFFLPVIIAACVYAAAATSSNISDKYKFRDWRHWVYPLPVFIIFLLLLDYYAKLKGPTP